MAEKTNSIDEEENKEIVTVFTGEAETFCPDSNFGNTYVKMYILEDKIAGVSLQVQNSSDNEESNKQILLFLVLQQTILQHHQFHA